MILSRRSGIGNSPYFVPPAAQTAPLSQPANVGYTRRTKRS